MLKRCYIILCDCRWWDGGKGRPHITYSSLQDQVLYSMGNLFHSSDVYSFEFLVFFFYLTSIFLIVWSKFCIFTPIRVRQGTTLGTESFLDRKYVTCMYGMNADYIT
jgi:hypothetical protein